MPTIHVCHPDYKPKIGDKVTFIDAKGYIGLIKEREASIGTIVDIYNDVVQVFHKHVPYGVYQQASLEWLKKKGLQIVNEKIEKLEDL